MIHPASDKDHLLGAILDALEIHGGELGSVHDVGRWSLVAEPDAILFDLSGSTYRVSLHGRVEKTDGRIASTDIATRDLEKAIGSALGRRRYHDDGPVGASPGMRGR
jgi:hypothetical protein